MPVSMLRIAPPGPRSLSLFGLSCLLLLLLLPLTGQAQSADPSATEERYIVKFREGQEFRAEQQVRSQRGNVRRKLKRRRMLAATLSPEEIQRLRSHSAIEYVEVDQKRYLRFALEAQETPWGVDAIGAAQLSTFGSDRKICVIDSGYDLAHADLPGADRVSGIAQEGTDSWSEPGDSHGTHVAGTIAALDNDTGIIGANTSLGLSLHIVKVFDDNGYWGYASDLVDAVDSCLAEGSNIISMSLGGAYPTTAEEEVFEEARRQNVLSIAAAGNDGSSQLGYPASYDSVVSVGAVDESLEVASFSQVNYQVELTAPGVGVVSTVPGGGYDNYSGTSMATPFVAAAAALVWGLNTDCSSEEIRASLARSAIDLGSPGRDSSYGYGFVQPAAADALFTASGSCDVGGALEPPTQVIDVLEDGQPFEAITLAASEKRLFSIEVPEGLNSLSVTTSGGSGDSDLYVSLGTEPDTSSYDCRSLRPDNEESCSFDEPTAGTYYIALYGYTSATVATLVADFDDSDGSEPSEPTDGQLTDGVPVENLSVSAGESKIFTLEVPEALSAVTFIMSGGTGDADLYVKAGAEPSLSDYDCRSWTTSNSESCVFDRPASGVYFVLVHGWSSANVASLLASFSTVATPDPNDPPNAVLTVSTNSGPAPLLVNLDASSSSDDSGIESIDWSLGDGTEVSGVVALQHTFTESGTFEVILTVEDAEGLTDSTSTFIEVAQTNPNQSPVAVIDTDAFSVSAGDEVVFDGRASSDPDGYISDYQWDFGDGSTASGDLVYHTFTESGTFRVTLTITDDEQSSSTATVDMIVEAAVEPQIDLQVLWRNNNTRSLLRWTGVTTEKARIYIEGRNRPMRTRNDGRHKLPPRMSGRSYQVCDNVAGGNCSAVVAAP